MNLYILRHAEAVSSVPSGMDSDRYLTENGKAKMREYASGLKTLDISFDIIYSSPYIRAVETAEITAEVFKFKDKIKLTEHLEPGCNLDPLFTLLSKHKPDSNILLVSHEPLVSYLFSTLIFGKPNGNIDYKKCGFCCIEINQFPPAGLGSLKYYLPPKILKALHK
jgi:phosphohistidine phosphatase